VCAYDHVWLRVCMCEYVCAYDHVWLRVCVYV